MSSLPNSKSSFLHAARNCSALALAGAMVLPMTPVLAQDAAPAANAPVANAPTANTPATQNVAAEPSFTVDYGEYDFLDGRDLFRKKSDALYTGEYNEMTVKGTGFTKEWREQHGTVVIYIAATQDRPGNVEPSTSMLRFEEGKDFTIEDDGTFDAYLKIKPDTLESYYPLTEYAPDMTLEKVRYEVGILAEPKGQQQSTVQDIWARKNVVAHQALNANDYHPGTFSPMFKYDALKDTTKDQELLIQGVGFNGDLAGSKGMMYLIREKSTGSPVLAMSDMKYYQYDKENYTNFLEGGFAFITIKIPANTLDPSKEYVIEARSDYGYVSQPNDRPLLIPIVGLAPEHRGGYLGSLDLKFEGIHQFTLANPHDVRREYFSPSLTDEEEKQPATRGELVSLLYEKSDSPKVDLPEVSPWPDVKTDDPNYAAYIWARKKGVTFGWSDGKFHADAGISRATVAALTYRAAGSPAVQGVSSFPDVKPDSAFYREILWATQQGIINPDNGMFEASQTVNRLELAWMMYYFLTEVTHPELLD
ncbi:peptidase [Rothia sp. HMSC071C12]|uniref:S-layer homology domain-containing protein n=1 Tax=Rothia sp. HMSC071C12 TaxID=1739446 RepID=UPI0008A1586A|nr:S-layer homology domain-containing protein [Rothia sp. HMSC071C12]OFQ34499.1 peptidase [Rothia sp. HMSC071C12]